MFSTCTGVTLRSPPVSITRNRESLASMFDREAEDDVDHLYRHDPRISFDLQCSS